MKTCTKCKTEKSLEEFPNEPRNKDGKGSHCKQCQSEKSKLWQKNNIEKRKQYQKTWNASEKGKAINAQWKKDNPENTRAIQRRAKLKARYGITEQAYNEMLASQNHSCAICKKHESQNIVGGKMFRLAVDHCHDTGTIRGILCDVCNTSIGKFNHNVEILQQAIEYLKKSTK